MHRLASPKFHHPAHPPVDHHDPPLYPQIHPPYPDMFRQSANPPLIQLECVDSLLPAFPPLAADILKILLISVYYPRCISRLLLTLLMDERLALLYSNLSIHPARAWRSSNELLPRFSALDQCGTLLPSDIVIRLDSGRLSPICSIWSVFVPSFTACIPLV